MLHLVPKLWIFWCQDNSTNCPDDEMSNNSKNGEHKNSQKIMHVPKVINDSEPKGRVSGTLGYTVMRDSVMDISTKCPSLYELSRSCHETQKRCMECSEVSKMDIY